MKLPSMRWNTLACVGSIGALAAVGGSVVTILLAVSMVWALVSLALRRFPPLYQKSDLVATLPAWVFAAVMIIGGLCHWDPQIAGQKEFLSRIVSLLPFMLFALVLPRLRTVPADDLLDSFIFGSAFCGVLALPVALVQVHWFDIRAEGGAGNALPFAMVCAFFGSVALLNACHPERRRRVLGWVGYVAAVVCVLLSQSRGIMPIPIIALAILLVLYPGLRRRLYNWKSALLAIMVATFIAFVAADNFDRIQSLIAYFLGEAAPGEESSYALRLKMWGHASELISEQFWFGYGMQNRWALMKQSGLGFTHFHNGFITAMVDGGLVGLLALLAVVFSPLVSVWRNPAVAKRRERWFVALLAVASCLIGGMTNFIFFHDIYDSVFLWMLLLVAAPLAPRDTAGEARYEKIPDEKIRSEA